MRSSSRTAGRRLLRRCTPLAWLLVLFGAPAMTCPGAAPPPTLPLPTVADPPRSQEFRAQIVTGGGSHVGGTVYSGGALRGTYAPLPGMLIGVELGGGAKRNSAAQARRVAVDSQNPLERETVLSGRLLVGYGFWLYRRTLAVAAEAGLTPGLHSEFGGFVGPDLTLSLTAGGHKWWALTLGYRIAYMIPSRDRDWSHALYHLAALTLLIPRRARYAGFLQVGMHYGHLLHDTEDTLGVIGIVGFRFAYGY